MGYLSLYRKWRPLGFDDLAGQTAVVKTLKNALLNNRIAHAYLFCGPRGTGKTTTAKVFAKALNCIERPTIEPCNQCFSCEQINSGRSVDVIEIDAASNRGVNEIRDLREKVKYSPSEGDYKVYIIDEVHMLTKEAFNALLKTLEEPPENVVFILATTEPHKVIATIQSRCQRFDFGLLSIKDLKARLKYICEQEGVSIQDAALTLIARTAEGGMRDAISILDQAIAFGGDKVRAEDVTTILGKVDQQVLAEVVKVIARHDTETGLKLINEIADQGKDLNHFTKDLLFHFRDLMLIKECGLQNTVIDLPDELKAELAEQAEKFTIKELLKIMEVLSETDQSLKYVSQPKLMLEMMIIKLVSPAVDVSLNNIITRLANLEEKFTSGQFQVNRETKVSQSNDQQSELKNLGEQSKQILSTTNSKESPWGSFSQETPEVNLGDDSELDEHQADHASPTVREEVNISMDEMENYWEATMSLLNEYSQTRRLRALLLQGKPTLIVDNTLYITFPESSTFHKENAEKGIQVLEKALKRVIGQNLKVSCIFEGEEFKISQQAVLASVSDEKALQTETEFRPELNINDIENDPLVQKALQTFGGKVIRVEKE